MRKMKHYPAMEQQFEELASAIIMQAADDYKRYRFLLDTIDLRKYKDDIGKCNAFTKANREIKSVKYFFRSPWFYALSGLNGDKALIGLEKTYLTEYYPVRMEEMMDETKIGRFRVYDQD